jgi:hypothetical protein
MMAEAVQTVQGLVIAVSQKERQGRPVFGVRVRHTDGSEAWYNADGICPVARDSSVTITFERSATGFNNIISITPVAGAPAAPPAATMQPTYRPPQKPWGGPRPSRTPEERAEIVRMHDEKVRASAVQAAAASAARGTTPEAIIANAKRLAQYIFSGN